MAIQNPPETLPEEFSRGVPLDATDDTADDDDVEEVVVPDDPLNEVLPRGTCWQCDEPVCAGMGRKTEDGRRLCVDCTKRGE